MLTGFIALVLGILWIAQELILRKKHGLKPSSWIDFLNLGRKSKNENSDLRALYFASYASFSLAIWEYFLRSLFERSSSALVFALGFIVFLVLVFFRRQSFSLSNGKIYREEFLALWLAWVLLLQPWFAFLVLTPWLFWRSKYFSKGWPWRTYLKDAHLLK